ncbi:uncharacterized protein LOC116413779 [Galleria mellonella]|uniref:Uncharacterized protein LOC116413779 n=1 Tax=Galleria mellonella TaxID=7137 RepID=A0ABM3M843_GALME|nr:uncharacterized protein LOC116413779 [Galleria mellonella]
MSANRNECDITVVVGTLIVFALPLTLLIPGFSVWDVVPKVHIIRFHLFSQYLTWAQLNAAVVSILAILFCLYLEIRKRKLDDMVEKVLTVSQATDTTVEEERGRQAAAMRVCVELLDTSTEHYENLMLLHDELHKREPNKQLPPAIEPSSSIM